MYTPDRWVVIEIQKGSVVIQKVFAGWYGGFADGNSWKLNSGIVGTKFVDGFYEYSGYSGSIYRCNPNSHGMSMHMQGVLDNWLKHAKSHDNMQIRVLDLDESAGL